MKKDIKFLTKAAVIAAFYVVLILIQIPMGELAYGPIQLRIAEGLTILPFLEAAAIPGLFIGCIIGNFVLMSVSSYGIIDVVCGSLITLAAAYLSHKAKNKYTAMLPPVLLNGILVPVYLSYLLKIPYLATVLSVSGGEFFSVLIFGNIFYLAYQRVIGKQRSNDL